MTTTLQVFRQALPEEEQAVMVKMVPSLHEGDSKTIAVAERISIEKLGTIFADWGMPGQGTHYLGSEECGIPGPRKPRSTLDM